MFSRVTVTDRKTIPNIDHKVSRAISYSRYMRLSEVFLPELLERVSVGNVLAGILSVCVNCTVFSFVITDNNKKICAVFKFLYYFLCPKPAPWIDSPKSQYSKIFRFI